MVMHLPCVLAGVSQAVLDILGEEFGRNPVLIPNGIDCKRFEPGPRDKPLPVRMRLKNGVRGKGGGSRGAGEIGGGRVRERGLGEEGGERWRTRGEGGGREGGNEGKAGERWGGED